PRRGPSIGRVCWRSQHHPLPGRANVPSFSELCQRWPMLTLIYDVRIRTTRLSPSLPRLRLRHLGGSITMPVVPRGTGQLGGTWVTHPWVETGHTAIGFGIVNGPRGDLPALKEFVLHVEELGLDGFWVTDHPVWYPDCWISLAAVAGVTKRIRLGSL